MNQGAVLVDIRDADEHAREQMPGATNLPCPRSNRAGRNSRARAASSIIAALAPELWPTPKLQAGITGWCGMANLLQTMPRNRPRWA